jgi:hypothetical protein
MFQLADVGDPTYFTMYATYDEGSWIKPNHDEDSDPYLIYDVDDEEDMITPRRDLDDQLLVKEEYIV